MTWLGFAALTIIFYSLFDFFLKLSASKIHAGLNGVILNFVATLVLLVYLLSAKLQGEQVFLVKPHGLLFSVLAGIAVGCASIFFLKLFATGTQLSVSVPVVRIGIVVLVSALGIFFLKEHVSDKLIIGLVLSLLGLYFITTSS